MHAAQLSFDFTKSAHTPDVFTIYAHTSLSGKVYVGQTLRSMLIRWREHVWRAMRGEKGSLAGAIRKYGAESFKHVVLETCATSDESDAAEQKWIAHFKSSDKAFGYNLNIGGAVRGDVRSQKRREPRFCPGFAAEKCGVSVSPKSKTGMCMSHALRMTYSRMDPVFLRALSVRRNASKTQEQRTATARNANGHRRATIAARVRDGWTSEEIAAGKRTA